MYLGIFTLIVGTFKPFLCYFSNAKFVLVFIFTFFDVWFKSTDWNPLTLISSPTLIFFFSLYRKCKLQTNYLMNRFWRASIIYKCSQKTAFNALSLSPLLFSNEQQTLSRYQMWKDCPIFLDVIFCRPAALDDNRQPPKLSNHYYWNTSDLRKFFDQTYKKRSY